MSGFMKDVGHRFDRDSIMLGRRKSGSTHYPSGLL
jgi:hypothetical protein